MNKSKFQFSLRLSLGTIMTVFIIISIFLAGGLSYFATKAFNRERIRSHMADIVASGVTYVDRKTHEKVRQPDDENSAAYRAVKKSLQKLRGSLSDARFVYTVRQSKDGVITFVVDAEEKEEDMSHTGDVYKDAGPRLAEAFSLKNKKSLVEDDFYTDKWGTWLSGYAPIRNSDGTIEAVLCIDISAESIIGYENQFIFRIFFISIIMIGVGSLVGFILAKRIGRPLQSLEDDMHKIRAFQIEEAPIIESRISEIVKLREGISNMKTGLRSFRRFVPAAVVADLLSLGKEAVPGAEKKELTILFTDIANFTSIAEEMDQDELVENLRIYFAALTHTLVAHGATIDKYIGDSIMAFWGAPRDWDDHAITACQAALAAHKTVDSINEMWKDKNVAFRTRIGINTGLVSVGNFGYEERLNYTVIGDNVNMASRAEALNKIYRTRTIITEETRSQIGDVFELRKLDQVTVKGKSRAIAIYELIGEKGCLTSEEKNRISNYENGLELYFQKDFQAAKKEFFKVYKANPEDQAVKIKIRSCQIYEKEPPGSDWNGVNNLKRK